MIWEDYKKQLPNRFSDKDLMLLEKAFNFASEIHKNEKRLNGEPYINHPVAVSLKVADLQLNAVTGAAALLHDTYESDGSIFKKIRSDFGQEISYLVQGMTKVSKIEYHGAERSAESTRKMFMAMAQDIRVIIIKFFDRLHNLETLNVLPEEKRKRIALETLEIYAPIADRLGMGKIKLQLEDSAFKYAYPEEYDWIIKETREKIPERESYLKKKVVPLLKKELTKEKIEITSVSYRAKHYYSLWKKLLRNDMDWYMIYDLIAVRIIVNSVEDCYRTLGVIHKFWKPLPGRIKDYIALSKQNGYQSLHTTVFCVDKKVTEFQIRTPEMHEEAEQGIAAHWAWEMAGKPRQTSTGVMPHQKFAWVKQLRDWHEKMSKELSGEKFLESLKIDFFKNRVFVLTPKGDIIDLPEKSTPIDFAYHIHSDVGNAITTAKVNHRIVPLSYELQSGDMVEIFTQRNKKPNIKLLEYAKTPIAQSHIKAALKKQGILSGIFKEDSKELRAELSIVSEDRIGMINDVSTVLSDFRINIKSFISKETNDKYPSTIVTFSLKNKEQIEKIITRLKKIKGIEQISYRFKN